MLKPYLNKCLSVISLLWLFWQVPAVSAQSLSDLYIQISDAKTALQADQSAQALEQIKTFSTQFSQLENSQSEAGQAVSEELTTILADEAVTQDELTSLSKKLLAFEKEQNPVDMAAELDKFTNKVFPALDRLRATIETETGAEELKRAFLTFNTVWTRNEALVRPTIAHYGRIETSLSFLRASLEVEPLDKAAVVANLDELETALKSFVAGEDLTQSSAISSLSQGIETLEAAHQAFVSGQTAKGQGLMRDFISAWPSFESAVSTRSASLYSQVEGQSPVIMARGQDKDQQNKLAALIDQLKGIDTNEAYSAWGSMLILLREGVEALLIVLSLVSMLKAAGQKKGLTWVYGGAVLGLVASGLAAVLLHLLFPALTSGANREILEGFVGLFAVAMMLGIGIWLHSKSQAAAWQAYMERQMAMVLSTGSFVSMFALSFLAVFREGAETILFYAGILPNISLTDFLMGIGLAILVLVVLTVVFLKSAQKLPIHRIFQVLGWLIYLLAFKMLGVSLHTLQLTNIITSSHIKWLPSVDFLGIYPSWEVVLPQLSFVILAGLGLYWQRRSSHGR